MNNIESIVELSVAISWADDDEYKDMVAGLSGTLVVGQAMGKCDINHMIELLENGELRINIDKMVKEEGIKISSCEIDLYINFFSSALKQAKLQNKSGM